MNCFTLKAASVSGSWVQFTLQDLPVPISDSQFILMSKPQSPILLLKTVRRGDTETGLYEGDVISFNNQEWLICYERGFYAINSHFVIMHFNNLTDWKLVGTNTTKMSDINLKLKSRHMFKYRNCYFRLNDIVSAVDDKLILKTFADPIDISEISQECGISYNKQRLYLGDKIHGSPIRLHKGRLCVSLNGEIVDITTMEVGK